MPVAVGTKLFDQTESVYRHPAQRPTRLRRQTMMGQANSSQRIIDAPNRKLDRMHDEIEMYMNKASIANRDCEHAMRGRDEARDRLGTIKRSLSTTLGISEDALDYDLIQAVNSEGLKRRAAEEEAQELSRTLVSLLDEDREATS